MLRKASVTCRLVCRLHVELVDYNFEDVEFFDLKVPEQLLISLVGCVGSVMASREGAKGSRLLLVDLGKEAIPTIFQSDHLLRLEGIHIMFVAGFLLGVIALIHHVRMVHIA